MKLGVYIGSFNPPHIGHIDVINHLLNNHYVDKVLVVPTLGYWDKTDLIDIKDRINMLKFFQSDKIIIDDEHNYYKYTYELMRALKNENDSELYLIIGADNIINFSKWMNYQELLEYKIIIVNREGIDISKYIKKYHSNNFVVVNNYNSIPISSSQIRKNLDGKYLDSRVFKYIVDNNLYK